MRSGTWNAVAAVVLPLAMMTASCEKESGEDARALAEQVGTLERRLAALEKQNLAAEVEQLKSKVGDGPAMSEMRVRRIAAAQAEQIVSRSVDGLRSEMSKKLRAAKTAGGGAKVAAKAGGWEPPEPAGGRGADKKRKKGGGDRAGQQAAALEKKAEKKAASVGKKAGLADDQVQALRRIFLERDRANMEIKRQAKAKEIDGKQAKGKMADAKRSYEGAIARFLDGLPADQRADAEKILKPQKKQREKKPKEKKERPAGDPDRKKKRGGKKGGKKDGGGQEPPAEW
ncbi:MAG: hypothetical protein ACYSU0_18730 [Planctomycetota bacterium]|jgi:hypothetical protein